MLTSTSSFNRDDDEKESPPSSPSLLHPNAPVKVTLRVRGEEATKNTRERAGGKWTSDQFALGLLSFASTTAEAFRSRGETTTRTRKTKTKRKDEAPGRVMVTLRVDEEESVGKQQKLEQNQEVKVHRARTWRHPGDDDGSSFDREKKKTSRSMSPPIYSRRRHLEDDCNASFSVWRLSDERDLNESHDEYEDEFREEKRHARKKQTFTPSYPATEKA